mmetsp:Transcript_18583/g.17670  ORF Transcript_18583/g.17670 Transcript_18583/m.17670 type:complete len:89 (-) Transcript_18583:142-408(-)
MNVKHQEMMKKLEERKNELRRIQLQRKEEKERVKLRTFDNLNKLEEEKELNWMAKQEQERLKDLRIKLEKDKQAKMQQRKVEENNKKI